MRVDAPRLECLCKARGGVLVLAVGHEPLHALDKLSLGLVVQNVRHILFGFFFEFRIFLIWGIWCFRGESSLGLVLDIRE